MKKEISEQIDLLDSSNNSEAYQALKVLEKNEQQKQRCLSVHGQVY